MSNILLAHAKLSDAATIYAPTGESDQSYAPVTNLQKIQPKDVWQTQGVASTIKRDVDLLAGASYNLVALLFTNASSTATWTLSTGTNGLTFGTTLISGQSFRAGGQSTESGTRWHGFYYSSTAITDRYLRIQISDTSNADGYFRAGRLVVASGYQPTTNMLYGMAFGFEDLSTRTLTTAGETITRRIEPVPTVRFTLEAAGTGAEAEVYNSIHALARRQGSSRDVLAILDPSDSTYGGAKIYYGLLQPGVAIEVPSYNLYRTTYQITGLL